MKIASLLAAAAALAVVVSGFLRIPPEGETLAEQKLARPYVAKEPDRPRGRLASLTRRFERPA